MAAGKRKDNESFVDYRNRLKFEQEQIDRQADGKLLFSSARGGTAIKNRHRKSKSDPLYTRL
jgi:hypothetical protein